MHKNEKQNRKEPEFRIRGISDASKQLIENIAQNRMGLKGTEFMKLEIKKIISSASDKEKRPPLKD